METPSVTPLPIPAAGPCVPVPMSAAPRYAAVPGVGAMLDRGVAVLTLLAAASLVIGSFASTSNSRELLPIMVFTSAG